MGTAFGFVENFLKEVGKWEKYQQNFISWRMLYSRFWCENIDNAGFNEPEKRHLQKLLSQVMSVEKIKKAKKEDHYFYSNTIDWNSRFYEAKNKILDCAIEVVSFDIFDTLIFRPFSEPTDLFYFVGEKLRIMNFKELRKQMEKKARNQCYQIKGHYEVTLEDIWKQIEHEIGISKTKGMQVEIEKEQQFCYANPLMQEIYKEIKKRGKTIIIVSDMYLPKSVLQEILEGNGYGGYEKLYVSCEYEKSKWNGELYEVVKQEYSGKIIHIGDNRQSDVVMARKKGIDTCYYFNICNLP